MTVQDIDRATFAVDGETLRLTAFNGRTPGSLPPAGNHLPIPVQAGEKTPR